MAEYNMRIAQKNEFGGVDVYYPQTKAKLVLEDENRRFITKEQFEKIKQAELKENKNKADGYAGLNEDGVLEFSVIPPEAMTQRFDANNDDEMLALKATIGDVVCRTDMGNTYFMLMGNSPQVKAAWLPISGSGSEGGAVLSVNGKTGNVVIEKSDVGLGNVTNESKQVMFHNTALTGKPITPTPTINAAKESVVNIEYMDEAIKNKRDIIIEKTFPGTPKKNDVFFEIID